MSFLLPFSARSSAALVAVGDPSRDRTVYATIVLLVALGFTMILLAVWLLRSTRPDPEVLAPLEKMGQRKWRRADPVWQRRHLDELRPGGADPLEPMSAPPATDAEFERGPQPIGFDDLAVESTAAAGTMLPAPTVGAVALVGPVDGDPDAGDVPVAEAAPTEDQQSAVAAAEVADGAPVDDAPADGETAGDGDDDDEDITGEQDTEDFLAVLDQGYELDPEVAPDVVEDPATEPVGDAVAPDAVEEPEIELAGEAVEPDAVEEPGIESVGDAVNEPEVDRVGESDDDPADPASEPDVEPASEPDVEPAADPSSDPEVESEVVPVSDADVEPTVDPVHDPDVDERAEPG